MSNCAPSRALTQGRAAQHCKSLSILILCSLVLIAGRFRLEAAGVLRPGETLILTTGNATVPADGDSDDMDPDCDFVAGGTCVTDLEQIRFGARTTAFESFSRGTATVFRYYDFDVDSGGSFDTPLLSQISGKAKLNGFVALVGGGRAKGSLTLKVIDLGPTMAQQLGGRVIHKETLVSHELKGVITTGLNFGVKVEGGAPYIGAGAGPELKFNVNLQKELVRDGIGFGLHVLLIRGHSYRLQFELHALAKKGATRGLSIAQFFPLGGLVPDMLDTMNWLDGVKNTINAQMPNLKLEKMDVKKNSVFTDEDGNKTEGSPRLFFFPRRFLDGAPGFPTRDHCCPN